MKVIIADSNDIVRAGLNAILSSDPLIQVVDEAVSGEELLKDLKAKSADVILLDYTAPNFSIDIIPKILSSDKRLKIVAITPEQNPSVILDALKSGVMSYIKKDCDIPEILSSVKETSNGNKFFCGQILDSIRKASIDVDDLNHEGFSCEPVLLSERELEIIKYIAEGNTNAQIADVLCLSPHTITTHRKNIMAKLGTKNTAGIVMYAVKSNLVSPNKFLFTRDV
ncbi:response regulator transcription factor [Brumimicrobium aurantiacum]|uniref:DNA-binding response regulator n=1 Tax=Brumimicrobium aurantiacum TaxID=1737063 RepID=A0A3E1EZQ1_9FLAO|nr:response regulator transcription factor [Brumimicrobium aurantiacum]RFC55052.1 DNA-binding response regulator [Brumimicrobium aurantiacum]